MNSNSSYSESPSTTKVMTSDSPTSGQCGLYVMKHKLAFRALSSHELVFHAQSTHEHVLCTQLLDEHVLHTQSLDDLVLRTQPSHKDFLRTHPSPLLVQLAPYCMGSSNNKHTRRPRHFSMQLLRLQALRNQYGSMVSTSLLWRLVSNECLENF